VATVLNEAAAEVGAGIRTIRGSGRAKSVVLVRNEQSVRRRISRLRRNATRRRDAVRQAIARKGPSGHVVKAGNEAAAVVEDAPGPVVQNRPVTKLSRNEFANVPRERNVPLGKSVPREKNVRPEKNGLPEASDLLGKNARNDLRDRAPRNRLGRMLSLTRRLPATMMNLEWVSGKLPQPAADAAALPRIRRPQKRANAAPVVAVVADAAMRKTK